MNLDTSSDTPASEAARAANRTGTLPALVSRSRLWLGTPWAANSCQPGPRGGVACHLLPRAVYIGAGWLPEEFPSIEGSALAGRHQGEGIIEAWVDGRPEFRRRPAGEPPQPGDLLGFKLQRVVDHLGVMLVGRQFIHVLQRKNTTLDLLDDPTWSRRLAVAWEVLSPSSRARSAADALKEVPCA